MELTIIRRHCRGLLVLLLLVLSGGSAWAQAGQVYTGAHPGRPAGGPERRGVG